MKKLFKNFSIKKYLLTVIITIITSIFINFTILFIGELPKYNQSNILVNINQNSEYALNYANVYQESGKELINTIENQKNKYGTEYPAEGLLVQNIIYLFKTQTICNTYVLGLILGLIIGTIIYVIFVQKAKKSQMLVELAFIGFIIILMFFLLNSGYNLYMNNIINHIGPNSDTTEQFNLLNEYKPLHIVSIYCIVLVLSYVFNIIHQLCLSKKLNNKLNNK